MTDAKYNLKLVIGDKNLSSWSLRPWLALKEAHAEFEEIKVLLDKHDTDTNISKYSPSGKVPALVSGDFVVCESLAICEYVAELFPKAQLWPLDQKARAVARSVSMEMHAGFADLRNEMPMRCAEKISNIRVTPQVQENVDRIVAIWKQCRSEFGQRGEMLFGKFSIADAMFAPVVTRFNTYGVEIDDPVAREYMKSILSLSSMKEWLSAAAEEIK